MNNTQNMNAPGFSQLSAAERVRPDHRTLDGHEGALLGRLAALCRELQRDARDEAFKCPYSASSLVLMICFFI